MKAIETTGFFLKCDAPGCDHVENVPAITADHIGMACPKCGANLLTREDFSAFEQHTQMVDAINALAGDVDPGAARARVSFHHHAGDFNITISSKG